MEKCPSYGSVRLTIVRLIEVFLWETHLRSAGTCGSVRLREVSVLWDVRLKRFHCNYLFNWNAPAPSKNTPSYSLFHDPGKIGRPWENGNGSKWRNRGKQRRMFESINYDFERKQRIKSVFWNLPAPAFDWGVWSISKRENKAMRKKS